MRGAAERGQLLQRHAVLRQRPRLIDTEHRHRAESLHGGDALDERVAFREPPGAEREKDGEHDGKFLGDRRHRDGDARECRFDDAAAPVIGGGDDEGQHHDAEYRAVAHKAAGLFFKRGRPVRGLGDVRADLSIFCARSRFRDARHGASGDSVRPRVAMVGAPAAPGLSVRDADLPDDLRFAGERRLVGSEAVIFQQFAVRGDPFALRYDDYVAWDELFGGERDDLAAAHRRHLGRGERLEHRECPVRLPLLIDIDRSHKGYEDEHDGAVAWLSQEEIEASRADEQQEYRFREEFEQYAQRGVLSLQRERIFPVPFPPLLDLAVR